MNVFRIFLFLVFLVSARADPTVRVVQKKLKSAGYYQGAIDGDCGSQTAAAIRRYQLANNLRVTGSLNEQTLQSLKVQRTKISP